MLSCCGTGFKSTVLEQVTLYTYAVSYNGDLHQNGYAVAIVAALVQAPFFTSHLAGFDLLVVQCRLDLVPCTSKETRTLRSGPHLPKCQYLES